MSDQADFLMQLGSEFLKKCCGYYIPQFLTTNVPLENYQCCKFRFLTECLFSSCIKS